MRPTKRDTAAWNAAQNHLMAIVTAWRPRPVYLAPMLTVTLAGRTYRFSTATVAESLGLTSPDLNRYQFP